MATHSGTRVDTEHELALRRLVEGQGLCHYAFFFVTGEGNELPNGLEETSGFVLNSDGTVYSFWTGWDASLGQATLAEWERVEPETDWIEEPEYCRARQAVGLTT